jgi:uncharacterized protein (DUF1778 family)
MQSTKRTVQINVRMTSEDYALLEKAANALWPEAVLTKSGIVLGLARIGAKDVLKKKTGGRRISTQ